MEGVVVISYNGDCWRIKSNYSIPLHTFGRSDDLTVKLVVIKHYPPLALLAAGGEIKSHKSLRGEE